MSAHEQSLPSDEFKCQMRNNATMDDDGDHFVREFFEFLNENRCRAVGATIGGVGGYYLGSHALDYIGFTANGVRAGSLAALAQSKLYGMYDGDVEFDNAGGETCCVFSWLQSAGADGKPLVKPTLGLSGAYAGAKLGGAALEFVCESFGGYFPQQYDSVKHFFDDAMQPVMETMVPVGDNIDIMIQPTVDFLRETTTTVLDAGQDAVDATMSKLNDVTESAKRSAKQSAEFVYDRAQEVGQHVGPMLDEAYTDVKDYVSNIDVDDVSNKFKQSLVVSAGILSTGWYKLAEKVKEY